jgi:NAD(P)-dependent dehydrogenase (short-subunit alcohol dehydrogenase family)
MTDWTLADVPLQAGRSVVVTGTGGLGYETALALAGAGANVILAGRDAAKGAESVARVKGAHPAATIAFEALDLASLASVKDFAGRLIARGGGLDLRINNAGVMMPPTRRLTADGFELQFGTNHLGHFALTAQLLPLLRAGTAPRVVSVSSGAHQTGRIRFDDLQWERGYSPWAAYSQSKLANLMFALELQRRSDAHGWGLLSDAAHPGYARTDLITNGPGDHGSMSWVSNLLAPIASQSAADGALPTLFAATSPDAKGGGYYGPSRMFEMNGPPKVARIARQAKDEAVAARLWEMSESLTDVGFENAAVAGAHKEP